MQLRKILTIAVIGAIVVVALSVGIAYDHPAPTVGEVCTVLSLTHSYSYNPDDNSSYVYANTTSTMTLEVYNSTVAQSQSAESVVTATGTTVTASGEPGISWNETVCTLDAVP